MATVKVYNIEGVESGAIDLDDAIFAVKAPSELMYQVATVLRARKRQPLAHTKDRGDVRGGGKKPWAQKGTGRARHGSIRSPLWRGGGVTFGPRKESLTKPVVPKRMAKKALRAAISDKVFSGMFIVLDDVSMEEPSTKKFVHFFKQLKLDKKKVLFLSRKNDLNAVLSIRNIALVDPVNVENVNVLELLGHDTLVISKPVLELFTKQLS